jgi:low affinity Fe/Cu permease
MHRPGLDSTWRLFVRIVKTVSTAICTFMLQVLHALDESKRSEGARLIHRYQHLIDAHRQ